jgi:Transcriptional Coactivator p15 (PC4)
VSNTSTRGASATSTKTTTADEMTVVHTFAKNAFEEVRAYLQPYKGSQLAQIRVFTPDKNDVDRPTRKGIALNIRDLPKLAQAVDALLVATEASRK